MGKCSFCGSETYNFITAKDYNRHVDTQDFIYTKCSNCGAVHLLNVPENPGRYYVDGYQKIPESRAALARAAEFDRYKIEFLRRYKTGGRLLEIGPWVGYFCYLAKEDGFDVTAIEMDGAAVGFIRDVIGATAIQSSDPAQALSDLDDQFDVIALWQCMEHLVNPWQVIAKASARLAPGGILLVSAPNPDSVQFSVLKKHWHHLDAPRHVNFLPISWYARFAKEFDLELISHTTNDFGSRRIEQQGWWNYWRDFFRIRYIRYPFYMAAIWLSRLIYARRTNKEGGGSSYTLVLRKISGATEEKACHRT